MMTPFAHHLPFWHSSTWSTTNGPLSAVALFDGTLFTGYEISGLDIFSSEDERLMEISRHLRGALNSLPANAYAQVEWSMGHSLDDVLDDFAKRCTKGPAVVQEQRRHRLRQLRKDPNLVRGRLFIYLGLRKPLGAFNALEQSASFIGRLFGGRRKGPTDVTAEEVAEVASQLAALAERFTSELTLAGMRATRFDENALIARIFAAMNPLSSQVVAPPRIVDEATSIDDAAMYAISRQFTLREQLPRGDLFAGDHHFTLDEPALLSRALSLQTLPAESSPDYLFQAQFALRTPFRIVSTFAATDHAKLTEDFLRKQRIATSETGGHIRNIQAEMALADIHGMIGNLAKDQRVFNVSVSAIVTGTDTADLDKASAAMKEAFRSNAEMSTEVGRQLRTFLGTLPGYGWSAPRTWAVHTNVAANLFPYFVPATGDAEAQLVYHTRQRSLRKISYAATTPRNNRNGVVFGPAGSGKSFSMALLFEQAALADGCSVDVVDVQGPEVSNYRILCDLLGGTYVSLASAEGASGLNTFPEPMDLFARDDKTGEFVVDQHSGKRKTDDFKVGEAAKTILLIGFPSYRDHLETIPLWEEIAQSTLLKAYQNLRDRHVRAGGSKDDAPAPVVDDIIAVLDDEAPASDKTPNRYVAPSPEYAQLQRRLRVNLISRMKNPLWARLLNRRSPPSPAKFRVFDFYGMDRDPDLATVLVQMMTNRVWATIQATGRLESKFILWDECWKLIQHPVAAKNIVELFRTGRKWGASVWAITQSLDDLLSSPVSSALLTNSSTIWLNRHAKDHDAVAKYCQLNSRQKYLFQNLQFVAGQYSEILFVDTHAKDAVILQSRPTAFDLWLNTTNPADVGLRDQVRREENVSMLDAIRLCAERYPGGSAAAARAVPERRL